MVIPFPISRGLAIAVTLALVLTVCPSDSFTQDESQSPGRKELIRNAVRELVRMQDGKGQWPWNLDLGRGSGGP